jgi:hypothetical protein
MEIDFVITSCSFVEEEVRLFAIMAQIEFHLGFQFEHMDYDESVVAYEYDSTIVRLPTDSRDSIVNED